MEIHSTGGVGGPDPVQPSRIPEVRTRPPTSEPPADRVEVSDQARFLAKLREVPAIREEKVEALRALIASGRFETSQRIRVAVERLLEELG